MKLYRAMRVAADGLPQVGATAKVLGVRPGSLAPHNDVTASAPTDQVTPGTGGLSVTPDDPMNLPRHLRPAEFGGTGREPVWVMEAADLPPGLLFRRTAATHGLIEPAAAATLAEYQQTLASTRAAWQRVTPPAGGSP